MVKFLSLQWNTATFSVLTVHIKSNYLEKEKYDFSKKQKTLKKKNSLSKVIVVRDFSVSSIIWNIIVLGFDASAW